jgi:WD40 repeat protein
MKNPDYLISCSADKTVRIWEIEKGENIRIIRFDK